MMYGGIDQEWEGFDTKESFQEVSENVAARRDGVLLKFCTYKVYIEVDSDQSKSICVALE